MSRSHPEQGLSALCTPEFVQTAATPVSAPSASVRHDLSSRRAVRRLGWLGLLILPSCAVLLAVLPLIAFVLADTNDVGMGRVLALNWLVLDGVLIAALFKVFWVRVPASDGIRVERAECPDLFALVDRLATSTRAPAVTRLVVSGDMNASAGQLPRALGVLGYTNELTIGLPLLLALNKTEFFAVIAHELAHFSTADGKAGALAYRARMLWTQLAQRAETRRSIGWWAMRRFAAWYRPRLERTFGGLSRIGEFRADSVAGAVCGTDVVAAALVRLRVASAYHQHLWQKFWGANIHHAEPPIGPYTFLERHLAGALTWARAGAAINLAAVEQTGETDTHPSLRDRLARLDAMTLLTEDPAGLAGDRGGERAVSLLGPAQADLVTRLNAAWWRENVSVWTEFFATIVEQHDRLDELDQAEAGGAIGLEEALERAHRADYLRGADAAGDALEACVRRFPNEPAGYYELGVLLLREGDDRGIAPLLRAIALDETASETVLEQIVMFLVAAGEPERAQGFASRRDACVAVRVSGVLAQGVPRAGEPLVACPLASGAREALGERVGHFPAIASAYLVQRRVRPWDGTGRAVLLIEPVRRLRRGVCRNLERAVGAEIQALHCGVSIHVVVRRDELEAQFAAARALDGSRVYGRYVCGRARS